MRSSKFTDRPERIIITSSPTIPNKNLHGVNQKGKGQRPYHMSISVDPGRSTHVAIAAATDPFSSKIGVLHLTVARPELNCNMDLFSNGVIADVTDYFSPSVKMSVTYNTNKQDSHRHSRHKHFKQIDGFEQEKKVVVIAATNRMQDLDPALISRFDSMITFGLPDQQTRQEIAAQSIKVMMESGCEEVQNPRANLRRKRQRKRENLEDGPNISW
ncbi:ATP-dependent zinc metalloprotease FtsH 4 [Camellia lanceoleosa]|uniref:ATP-dependent zinc metalloprotease FtsH 4 n=1 Tax=Camellia lanceoleosa TaxID=1840588 RepID=A0ACC0I2W3_9ERIC|nr:ATP-dependent zinc metalloprotease FtsH 4 [Camellia lanceoleosa]